MDYVQIFLLTLLLGLVITLVVSFLQSTSFKKIGVASKHSRPTFFILGQNNAGKTSLFYRLAKKEPEIVATVSSIDANYGDVSLPIANPLIAKPLQFIDFPGHLKYSQLLKQVMLEDVTLGKIKGIVYVIDASTTDFSEIAKHLFNLLVLTERVQNGIDILFAVNKSDLFNSRPPFKIQEILELEITKLIKQSLSEKSSQIESGIDQDDESEENSLGNEQSAREFWSAVVSSNRVFKFEMLEGNMDFFGGSILKDKVESWENWLDERVVN